MKKIKSNIIILFCLTSYYSHAQYFTDWKLAKFENNTQISYRWVTSKNGKKAREMRTVFTANAPISLIVNQINDASNLKKWLKTIYMCSIELHSPTQWETYTLYKLPWPLKSKNLVTKSEWIETETHSIVKTVNLPNSKPKTKNSNKIHSYSEEWKLIPLSNNKTEVIIKSISYDKVKFPRALTDPIIQNKMIASIELLKKQLLEL
ncbi:MAG: hypothetical protein V3U92_13110 [Cellulophaga sp.]